MRLGEDVGSLDLGTRWDVEEIRSLRETLNACMKSEQAAVSGALPLETSVRKRRAA
jgi:hypothetical protein